MVDLGQAFHHQEFAIQAKAAGDLLGERLSLEDYSRLGKLKRDNLAETGITIKEYIIRQKMQMAQSLLRTTTLPIGFVAGEERVSPYRTAFWC